MGILKKIKGIMDPYESMERDGEGYPDQDDGVYEDPLDDYNLPGNNYNNNYAQQSSYNQGGGYGQGGGYNQGGGQTYQQPQPQQPVHTQAVTAASGSPLSLKVVKPEKFDDVVEISTHLLNHNTVVLNLEDTNKEASRRIIDFLSGVAFAIEGHIKKVSNLTFVIVPNNVDISADKVNEEVRNNSF